MRGVPALSNALHAAPAGNVSAIVVWEPVIPTDRRGPTRRVTQPLDGLGAARFYDPTLIASRAAVRTAMAHPERIPPGFELDANTIAWDLVAIYPPGARWEGELPFPEWLAMPVVESEVELTRRLAALKDSPVAPRDPQRPR